MHQLLLLKQQLFDWRSINDRIEAVRGSEFEEVLSKLLDLLGALVRFS